MRLVRLASHRPPAVVHTAKTVLNALPAVSNSNVPLAGAVHLNHTELAMGSGLNAGLSVMRALVSQVSKVADVLLPLVLPELPRRVITLAKLSLVGAAPTRLAASPTARTSSGFNQRAARARRPVIRLAIFSRIFFTTFLHSSREDWPRGFNFKNSSAGSVRKFNHGHTTTR